MIGWKNALLTGGTGAIGPAIAAEMLASNPQGSLSVLIRPGAQSATDRFNEWLESVASIIDHTAGPRAPWRGRVSAVAGDVRTENLGISADRNRRLQGEVDLIVHAAADTQFKSVTQEQWDINVEGTRRVLEWSTHCRATPRIICVSTVCTSGTQTGCISETFSKQPPEFVNNYERTKWEAERLALHARLNLSLARVSIVMGSYRDGAVYRPGALHQIFKWFARGFVPVIQGTDSTQLDLIATETASQFLAKAASVDWKPDSIWHIAAGPTAAPLPQLASLAFEELTDELVMQNREEPGKPFIVDSATYARLQEAQNTRRQRVTRQAMDALGTFLPMLLHARTYDTAQAEKLWGGPLPLKDWRQTMRLVMRYCDMSNTSKETDLELRRKAG